MVLFGLLFSASEDQEAIGNAICGAVDALNTTISGIIFILILLTLPVLILGIFFYFFQKEDPKRKKAGLIMIVIVIILDILLILGYLLLPSLIGVVMGMDANQVCG